MTYEQWLAKYPLPADYRAETIQVTTALITRCQNTMKSNRISNRTSHYIEDMARTEWALRRAVL